MCKFTSFCKYLLIIVARCGSIGWEFGKLIDCGFFWLCAALGVCIKRKERREGAKDAEKGEKGEKAEKRIYMVEEGQDYYNVG